MSDISALAPIDPNSIPEKEKASPWIARKLVGSMTGRFVISSYQSLKAAGTSVVCLSPWGDSSPLVLPCIRVRDLALKTAVAATGGTAQVLGPVMDPVADLVISSAGDTVLVENCLDIGFNLATKGTDFLFIDEPVDHVIRVHSNLSETTGVKAKKITLKYKHTIEDAALGFYRSSVHQDNSLFASIKDYLAIEKGWFSPYLFASGRHPIIPRSMKPDVIFCHGPFLEGDYKIGEALLAESAPVIMLSKPSPPLTPPVVEAHHSLAESKEKSSDLNIPRRLNMFSRSRTPSPEPELTPSPVPKPRRMVILLVGLKPHRGFWTNSGRPGESVINYILLRGCPAVVVPVQAGSPLIAWDGLTLEQLWDVELPEQGAVTSVSGKYEGIVNVLFEFVDMCVEWERFVTPGAPDGVTVEAGRTALKNVMQLLVAAAIRSKDNEEVKKEVDKDRSGIAMWRIP